MILVRTCPKVCSWESKNEFYRLVLWLLKFSPKLFLKLLVSCVTFQYSTRQAGCCLRGQGPIWASECPGSLMWQCTCLAFQSSHPKPRTRPRHQRARPALTHMQQQPGHLWSFGSPRSCVYMCVRLLVYVCVRLLHPDSVWDLTFQPTLTLTQAVFGQRATGSRAACYKRRPCRKRRPVAASWESAGESLLQDPAKKKTSQTHSTRTHMYSLIFSVFVALK